MPTPPPKDEDPFADAQEMHRLIVESAPNAMVLSAPDGRIVLVNRQAEVLFGYERSELLGRSIELLLPPEAREAHAGHRAGFNAAPETRKMGAGRDLYGLRKDGRRVPLEIGLNPIRTDRGVFVLAAIVDITERKNADERFRIAVEAAPNAMIMSDERGRIVLANAQAARVFGYGPGELLGLPIEALVPPRFHGSHSGHRERFHHDPLARPMGAGRELYGLRKDGREVPIEIGLNPIRTDGGTLVLAAIVDITERREMQRKLAQNEALAAVGGMVAVMAHEIRNPLGSILMAARSLERGGLAKEERELVSGILSKEADRLNRTLQDFLHFARPKTPKRALLDLNGQVQEIVRTLSSDEALAKRVRLETTLDPALPPVSYDPDQVGQVLWNLLLNGIQAMDGEGRLEIATAVRGNEACVLIADSGPGIAPEALDRLFEPFFTTKKKGTGLGLAIARRIVEAHEGRLSADNRPEGGARFCLLLPLRAP